MTIDLDRITHPLRLARGSHEAGSGKGCAMNVVSYMNGDTMITDFPDCSARPLAAMVQRVNDMLAGPDGFLSPEDSVLVIDMGYRTMGTADVARDVVWRWLSDLLIDPEHGVMRFARREQTVEAIQRVSALCLRRAANDPVTPAEWRQARKDAQEARKAAYADAYADAYAAAYAAAAAYAYAYADADAYADAYAAAYAAAAAYADAYADAAADADAYAAAYAAAAAYAYADAYAAAAADADAYADAAAYAAAARKRARIDFTNWAIDHWRELAGLDQQDNIQPDQLNKALAQING